MAGVRRGRGVGVGWIGAGGLALVPLWVEGIGVLCLSMVTGRRM